MPQGWRFAEAATLVLYLLLVSLSLQLASARERALAYHTRDYAYYARFHAALFDAEVAPRYALNPRGRNFLGYRGVEGVSGLHRAVHLEPIKYLRAAFPAHAFDALLFFAPALYLVFRMPRRDARDRLFHVGAAAAYLLLPSGQPSVAYDLRPYLLLLPFFSLAVLALLARRSRLEALALFQLPFLAREEALVLAPIAILAAAADARARPAAGVRPPLAALWASVLAWAAATIAYFSWTGYERSLSFWGAVVLIAGGSAAAAGAVSGLARRFPGLAPWLPPLLLASVALPLLPRAEDATLAELLYHPRHALVSGAALLALVAAWPALRAPRARGAAIAAVAALALAFGAASLADVDGSARALRRAYAERARDAEVVFEARARLDRATSVVLCDYATHQAFFDFEHAYAFERLPWYLVPGDARFYPENQSMLRRLIRERVDVIAVAAESLDLVRAEVRAAGLSLGVVASNGRFTIARPERAAP